MWEIIRIVHMLDLRTSDELMVAAREHPVLWPWAQAEDCEARIARVWHALDAPNRILRKQRGRLDILYDSAENGQCECGGA